MSADLVTTSRPVAVEEPPRLTPLQRRAVLALLEFATVAEAADAVGVSARTLNRWLLLPHFSGCYRRLCDARETAVAGQFLQQTETALDVLSSVAVDKYKDLAQRVHASRHILEYADRRQARRNNRNA